MVTIDSSGRSLNRTGKVVVDPLRVTQPPPGGDEDDDEEDGSIWTLNFRHTPILSKTNEPGRE
jgi:hypothetical protein